jgi:hypothetical protein
MKARQEVEDLKKQTKTLDEPKSAQKGAPVIQLPTKGQSNYESVNPHAPLPQMAKLIS